MIQYEQIKKLCIIAVFSDDYFLEKLVLKGGNALEAIYRIISRGSIDLDFSMEKDFSSAELPAIENKLRSSLESTFAEHNLRVFDVEFYEKPIKKKQRNSEFWGGYCVEFKVIEKEKYQRLENNSRALRVNALSINDTNKKKIKIDISKFEYCGSRQRVEQDGYTIYIYTPEMILFEKLRAICQQMTNYVTRIGKTRTSRAKDFYDIHEIWHAFQIDLVKNRTLLERIFEVKKVPLSLLGDISLDKEFHRHSFDQVRSTVGKTIKSFDDYFEFVVSLAQKILETLRVE